MLAPCTVSDMDPVPSMLLRRITLSPGKSIDQPWLKLPLSSPAVTTTRRVLLAPCPIWHRTDVSDSHSVVSTPLRPTRALPVYVTVPKFFPSNVIDDAPVPARLPLRISLMPEPSNDHAWLTLPTLPESVINARRVPRAPCPT